YVGEKHHELSEGSSLLFAGEVQFNDGRVEWWNNQSGHFIPHPGFAHQVPLPIQKFIAIHVVEHRRHRMAMLREQEQAVIKASESDQKKSTAERLFRDLVVKKGGQSLEDLYKPSITKQDRMAAVTAFMQQYSLSKNAAIKMLVEFGILRNN